MLDLEKLRPVGTYIDFASSPTIPYASFPEEQGFTQEELSELPSEARIIPLGFAQTDAVTDIFKDNKRVAEIAWDGQGNFLAGTKFIGDNKEILTQQELAAMMGAEQGVKTSLFAKMVTRILPDPNKIDFAEAFLEAHPEALFFSKDFEKYIHREDGPNGTYIKSIDVNSDTIPHLINSMNAVLSVSTDENINNYINVMGRIEQQELAYENKVTGSKIKESAYKLSRMIMDKKIELSANDLNWVPLNAFQFELLSAYNKTKAPTNKKEELAQELGGKIKWEGILSGEPSFRTEVGGIVTGYSPELGMPVAIDTSRLDRKIQSKETDPFRKFKEYSQGMAFHKAVKDILAKIKGAEGDPAQQESFKIELDVIGKKFQQWIEEKGYAQVFKDVDADYLMNFSDMSKLFATAILAERDDKITKEDQHGMFRWGTDGKGNIARNYKPGLTWDIARNIRDGNLSSVITTVLQFDTVVRNIKNTQIKEVVLSPGYSIASLQAGSTVLPAKLEATVADDIAESIYRLSKVDSRGVYTTANEKEIPYSELYVQLEKRVERHIKKRGGEDISGVLADALRSLLNDLNPSKGTIDIGKTLGGKEGSYAAIVNAAKLTNRFDFRELNNKNYTLLRNPNAASKLTEMARQAIEAMGEGIDNGVLPNTVKFPSPDALGAQGLSEEQKAQISSDRVQLNKAMMATIRDLHVSGFTINGLAEEGAAYMRSAKEEPTIYDYLSAQPSYAHAKALGSYLSMLSSGVPDWRMGRQAYFVPRSSETNPMYVKSQDNKEEIAPRPTVVKAINEAAKKTVEEVKTLAPFFGIVREAQLSNSRKPKAAESAMRESLKTTVTEEQRKADSSITTSTTEEEKETIIPVSTNTVSQESLVALTSGLSK
ncbi:MAG: hypothetical protein IE916_00180 [Epsilonproteobacteria bacterium]|nr:hypothetical protein [Campylobacterota bacterium]